MVGALHDLCNVNGLLICAVLAASSPGDKILALVTDHEKKVIERITNRPSRLRENKCLQTREKAY